MNVKPSERFGSTFKEAGARNQQGMATILVVVLLGMSMTAMALGFIYSLKNTQEKQVAVHASTHAQVGLWSAVEAFRIYLATIETSTLEALDGVGKYNINLGANYGVISANNISVTPVGTLFHVSADIVNIHTDAKSSAAVGVTFEIDPNANDGSPQGPDAVINFYDSLELTGDITFNLVDGVGAKINVEGDVLMPNINVNNLDQLNATGSVTLGSAVQLELVHSGSDVTISGGAHVNTVLTEGRVETTAGAGIDVILANKSVILGGSGRSESVHSLEKITVNAGSHGTLNAAGDIDINSGAGTLDELQTQSNVNALSAIDEDTILSLVFAEGDFNCGLVDWGSVVNLSMNGTLDTDCDSASWTSVATAAGVSVTVMEPVTPVTIPPVTIDVWTLRDQANYIFEYDTATGQTKVTLYNINGVTNGTPFRIGSYTGAFKSYLCKVVNSSGICTDPATPGMPICLGHSTSNECIVYGPIDPEDASSPLGWRFDGAGAAPGVMWFDGAVNLNNGVNYATILATGDVMTGGQLELYSVNYGGYEGVCLAQGSALTYRLGTYTPMFENQFPTNLCDKTNGVYTPIKVGNIGIASGGYSGSPATFSGGKVELGTNNQIFGSVLAGHSLTTGGQTRIHGYVTAAAQGGKVGAGEIANLLGANSTIDLTNTVSTYDAADLPMMGEFGALPISLPPPVDTDYREKSKILWTRYL